MWWLCAGSPRGCWKVALGGYRNWGEGDCARQAVSVRREGTSSSGTVSEPASSWCSAELRSRCMPSQ